MAKIESMGIGSIFSLAPSLETRKDIIRRLNELTLREPDPDYIPPPSVYLQDNEKNDVEGIIIDDR